MLEREKNVTSMGLVTILQFLTSKIFELKLEGLKKKPRKVINMDSDANSSFIHM